MNCYYLFWHPSHLSNPSEVQHFEVWEAQAKTEKDFLGDVYLDLYPRGISFAVIVRLECLAFADDFSAENKYSHAAVWGLVQGYLKEDHSRNYPVATMVANLAKPTPNRPALMRYDSCSITTSQSESRAD